MRAWIVATLALGLALPADVPPAPTDVPFGVRVHDASGRAVSTLTAADFEVSDNGRPVRVANATWVPARPPAGTAGTAVTDDSAQTVDAVVTDAEALAAAGQPDARVIALFLDEYHVAAERVPALRTALGTLLREHVRPADLVLTVKPLDSLMSLPLHRGRNAALAALASFEGRQGDYAPRNAFERDLIAADPVRIDRARTRIAAAAIQAIVTRLAGLGARRKGLLVVGAPVLVTRPAAGRIGDDRPSTAAIARVASRANLAISWLDSRGGTAPPVDEPGAAEVTLADLVRETDGRAIRVEEPSGLSAWLDDLGGYYLLTLEGAADGQFHPLDVRTPRAEWRAQARPGYWAISQGELARLVVPTAAPPPPPVLPPTRTSRLIVPWVGQTRAADGRTRVTYVWEPAPPRAGERGPALPPSRLRLRAQMADGTTVFDGVVRAVGVASGTPVEAQFDVPAGRIRLQSSIEDASARVLDTDVREVVVAPLSNAVSLGTPRVFRARTAREFAAAQRDPRATPAASRVFSRLERLLLQVPVYADGAPASASAVVVTADLLNRRGQTMRSLPVTREADPVFAVADLSLGGLAAGDYSVRWRAALATTEIVETLSFRIVP